MLLAGRGVVRAVRASAAASVVVMLASAAHAAAGGATPATGPLLLGTAVIAPICWLLSGRRLTVGRLATLLVAIVAMVAVFDWASRKIRTQMLGI